LSEAKILTRALILNRLSIFAHLDGHLNGTYEHPAAATPCQGILATSGCSESKRGQVGLLLPVAMQSITQRHEHKSRWLIKITIGDQL